MKRTLALAFALALGIPAAFAQQPTWAEQLFKVKTGQTHPEVQRRAKEQAKTQELQKTQQQMSELFSMLDSNRDGVISQQEWESGTNTTSLAKD